MLKKLIVAICLMCFAFSFSVFAENQNTVSEQTSPQAALGNPNENMIAPPSEANGEMPSRNVNRGERPTENFNPSQNEGRFGRARGDFVPPQGDFVPLQQNDVNKTESTDTNQDKNFQMPGGNQQFGGQMPEGMGRNPFDMQNQNTETEQEKGFWGFVKTNITPIISVILLALAFVFVIFYKRKNY